MTNENDIPVPVRFNPFKHHRNYILGILDCASPEVIVSLLDPVCNNYIDIYTGVMTSREIGNSIIRQLQLNQVFLPEEFEHWLVSKSGYRQITIEDQSEWILRKSNETDRYIHIHPAHEGPFTIRVKGSTLKTVCLLKNRFRGFHGTLSLDEVNRVRMRAGLSPVKKLDRNKGILKCFEMFA